MRFILSRISQFSKLILIEAANYGIPPTQPAAQDGVRSIRRASLACAAGLYLTDGRFVQWLNVPAVEDHFSSYYKNRVNVKYMLFFLILKAILLVAESKICGRRMGRKSLDNILQLAALSPNKWKSCENSRRLFSLKITSSLKKIHKRILALFYGASHCIFMHPEFAAAHLEENWRENE